MLYSSTSTSSVKKKMRGDAYAQKLFRDGSLLLEGRHEYPSRRVAFINYTTSRIMPQGCYMYATK